MWIIGELFYVADVSDQSDLMSFSAHMRIRHRLTSAQMSVARYFEENNKQILFLFQITKLFPTLQ